MNTVNKSERKKSDSSSTQMDHKLTQECFTKCAKWKLNLTMTLNKTSSGLVKYHLIFRYSLEKDNSSKSSHLQF